MQGSGSGDTVYTQSGIAYHGCGPDQHHKRTGSQCGIEDILSQTAAQCLHNNDGESRTDGSLPAGDSGGQGHGQQQTGDNRRAIDNGVSGTGDQRIQPFGCHSGSNTDNRHQQCLNAQHVYTHSQCGKQCDDHIQHDPVCAEITADMRGRSNC